MELFNALAMNEVPGHEYPQDEINENWKTVLRNQFHDIPPGPSIAEVYEDADAGMLRCLVLAGITCRQLSKL